MHSHFNEWHTTLDGRPALGKDGRAAHRKGGALEDQEQRYERARARVQAIKGFYIHASVFVLVNIGLFIINALTSGLSEGIWWFYWPLLGWGIGLGAHALGVFGFGGGGPWVRNGRNARPGR